jgi:hypothetical protein
LHLLVRRLLDSELPPAIEQAAIDRPPVKKHDAFYLLPSVCKKHVNIPSQSKSAAAPRRIPVLFDV